MSRELKFRVYIPELNKLVYFDLGGFDYPDRHLHNDKCRVQEYTGLKDSKGNPIYEGDIVNTIYHHDPHLCIGKVIYHNETASFRIKTYKNLLPIVTHRFVDDESQALVVVVDEVIGNKYQLPCKKEGSFDGNGECIFCDCWATDCACIKL
jgi:hypothetical protein